MGGRRDNGWLKVEEEQRRLEYLMMVVLLDNVKEEEKRGTFNENGNFREKIHSDNRSVSCSMPACMHGQVVSGWMTLNLIFSLLLSM